MNPLVGYDNIIPLLAPQDIASTATATSYMDLKGANRAAFLISIGAITTATATDTEVITIEGATAADGTEAAVAFSYRLSGALGANTWGAVTACASTGLSIASTDDNKLVWVELDLGTMAASDYRFARVVLTDTPDMTAFLVGVVGVLDVKYKQTTFVSATASASA